MHKTHVHVFSGFRIHVTNRVPFKISFSQISLNILEELVSPLKIEIRFVVLFLTPGMVHNVGNTGLKSHTLVARIGKTRAPSKKDCVFTGGSGPKSITNRIPNRL